MNEQTNDSGDDAELKNMLAVALAYDRGKDPAPRVVAKGKGYIAEQIVLLAEKHGIEVRKNPDLVNLLSKIDIDTPIPLEAYAAVAEILSYIYRANEKMKRP